ncbi:MAG: putative motility protein [Bacillota bacterium]
MEINNALLNNISSIRHAMSIAMLRKTLHQDTLSMLRLLQGFRNTNEKTMENSVTPHKGGNIDIKV